MIAIDNILVADAVAEEHFVCKLNVCKGVCCVEGDAGARLEENELKILDEIYERVEPVLTPDGRKAIAEQGKYVINKKGIARTPLINGGACAYVIYENNIVKCGIEKAYEAGTVNFKKPISCHLYPIRIEKKKDYEAVNYEQWDICSPACANGKKLKVRVFEFLKEPLIRKYGEEFYKTLEAAAEYRKSGGSLPAGQTR